MPFMLPDADLPSPDTRPSSRRARRRGQPAHEVRARRRRLLGWSIVGISCLLMVNALVGDNGYLATIRAQREYDALDASLARIRSRNQQLRDQVRRMRHDPTALEEAARERQGFIKPGETMVIVKDPPAPRGTSDK